MSLADTRGWNNLLVNSWLLFLNLDFSASIRLELICLAMLVYTGVSVFRSIACHTSLPPVRNRAQMEVEWAVLEEASLSASWFN